MTPHPDPHPPPLHRGEVLWKILATDLGIFTSSPETGFPKRVGGRFMAGNGRAPKDPSKRARANKDIAPVRYIAPARVVEQPDLPEFEVEVRPKDGEPYMVPYTWPEATRGWWAMLAEHPLVNEFFDTDWAYLLDTALIHAAFWKGNLTLAGELRLREAKYGFTPEDRAKLRIFSAAAVEGESKATLGAAKVLSARERYGQTKRLEA